MVNLNVMLAAGQYFGAANLNSFFASFDFTSFTSQLQSADLTNILAAWNGRGTLLDEWGQ